MALKSSNKVDTNVYEIEVTVAPEEFTQACKDAYLKRRKSMLAVGWYAVDENGRSYMYRELVQPGLIVQDAAKQILDMTMPDD